MVNKELVQKCIDLLKAVLLKLKALKPKKPKKPKRRKTFYGRDEIDRVYATRWDEPIALE